MVIIKWYSSPYDNQAQYWEKYLQYITNWYQITTNRSWKDILIDKLMSEYNTSIRFDYSTSRYTVYYPSEEVYFLFKLDWS